MIVEEIIMRKGLSLQDAFYKMNNKEDLEKYSQLKSALHNISAETTKKYAETPQLFETKFLDFVVRGLGAYAHGKTEISSQLSELKEKLYGNIKHLLREENLIAVGYESPRNLNDKPVIIPHDVLLCDQYNFSESEIYGNELGFINVRVLPAHLIEKQKLLEKPKEKTVKNMGRPSLKDDIIRTFEYLRNKEAINFRNPKIEIYKQISKRLASEKQIPYDKVYKGYKGINTKTIAKHISHLIDDETNKIKVQLNN